MIFDWYCLRNWQVYTFIRADESMKPRHETECHVCERRLVFHANIQVRVWLRTCWSRRWLLLDLYFATFLLFCLLWYQMKHVARVICNELQLEMLCYWGELVQDCQCCQLGCHWGTHFQHIYTLQRSKSGARQPWAYGRVYLVTKANQLAPDLKQQWQKDWANHKPRV